MILNQRSDNFRKSARKGRTDPALHGFAARIIAVSRATAASSAACRALDGGGCMAHNSP